MVAQDAVMLGTGEYLPVTCSKCGFTEWYSLSLARQTPPDPTLEITEVLPGE